MSAPLSRTASIERCWERGPLALPREDDDVLMSRDEIFAVLLDVARAFRPAGDAFAPGKRRAVDVRVFVDGGLRLTDVREHLPSEEDGSLGSFLARVEARVGDRPFEVIVNELQSYSFVLWERLRAALSPLSRVIEQSAARVEAALFLRRHCQTSLGVHRDNAGVLMFVIEGHKTLLTWPPEAFDADSAPVSALDYAAHRERASALRGGPGDVLYWPASHWHVAEAEPGWSISVNVGFHLDRRPERELMSLLTPLLAQGVDAHDDCAHLLRPLAEILDGDELASKLKLHRLARRTSLGVDRPPPLRGTWDYDPARWLRVPEHAQIVVEPWEEPGREVWAVNGHGFAVPVTRASAGLREQLVPGRRHQAADLLRTCAQGEPDAEELLRVLFGKLVARGALVVEAP